MSGCACALSAAVLTRHLSLQTRDDRAVPHIPLAPPPPLQQQGPGSSGVSASLSGVIFPLIDEVSEALRAAARWDFTRWRRDSVSGTVTSN